MKLLFLAVFTNLLRFWDLIWRHYGIDYIIFSSCSETMFILVFR